MFSLLASIFIKNRENIGDASVRRSFGMLSSIVGVMLNILLFSGKYFAGTISGSIAITADAFNNLSDASSSIVTFLGFRMAGKNPDREHPFGHGRIEYVSAFFVAMLILLMGFELIKTSVHKILNPEPLETGVLPMAILAVSILVKLYMFMYNRRYGNLLNSPAMKATAVDSISDTAATSVVLIATFVMNKTDLNIDGWCGLLVALFILRAGFVTVKQTVGDLLGSPPTPQLVKQIEDIAMSHECILGIHDLVIHDYGPGRLIISLHGEVPSRGDIMVMHDAIDHIERELSEKLGCEAVIHMDPVESDDMRVTQMKNEVQALVASIDGQLSIHDFRMVTGPTHTNLIFDVVMPYRFGIKEDALNEKIKQMVRDRWGDYYCVIKFDKPYL